MAEDSAISTKEGMKRHVLAEETEETMERK